MEKIRLSKLMAHRGLCSRREADAFIEQGLVYVDGERVSTLGTKVDPQQEIRLADRGASRQEQKITILLNKPVGFVSGQPEKNYPAALSLLVPANRFPRDRNPLRFRPAHLQGLAPAGRLDIDSEGLLVFTQDGRVARRLIGPDSAVEKEYLVRTAGTVTASILGRLAHGLSLDGKPLKPARVARLNEAQLQFVLTEGRKRQIRRMCELAGLKVLTLKRVRIGEVRLENLPSGLWRYLRPEEKF